MLQIRYGIKQHCSTVLQNQADWIDPTKSRSYNNKSHDNDTQMLYIQEMWSAKLCLAPLASADCINIPRKQYEQISTYQITKFTFPSSSNPSSWLRSSINVRWISRSALVPSLNLRPPMASISSMKMMHG